MSQSCHLAPVAALDGGSGSHRAGQVGTTQQAPTGLLKLWHCAHALDMNVTFPGQGGTCGAVR
jgi:hypothetical protein